MRSLNAGVSEMGLQRFILVADASKARLFRADSDRPGWALFTELDHPDSRASGQDLLPRTEESEDPVRSSAPAYRLMDYRTEAREDEARRFAAELARLLFRSAEAKEYDELVVVAERRFLARLRRRLRKPVAARIVAEVPKDYTGLTQHEMMQKLPF
jgi:protein required for attachment to host cells